MTQEEKQLLIKDLCARLPYGVKINVPLYYEVEDANITLDAFWLYDIQHGRKEIRTYLRPMSSMTEEEKTEWDAEYVYNSKTFGYEEYLSRMLDWLNKHYFDYRGLIEKGLALEAPDGMYEIE